MSTASFTKGPWRIERNVLPAGCIVTVAGPNRCRIPINAHTPENAKLIAAAPDLYEALEAIRDIKTSEEDMLELVFALRRAKNLAATALAKVTEGE